MSPSIDTRENREFASEIKFLVSRPVATEIRKWARAQLGPDPNGAGELNDAYWITSLYLDTEQFDVFHRRGSFGRSKYRIRRYGLSDVVFLERKLKTRGLLSKRRSIVNFDALGDLADEESERDWAGHWFHQRLLTRRFKPVCQISYQRTARVAMTNYGPIRLTLDEGLRALPARHITFDDLTPGTPVLANEIILELKFLVAMPPLFKRLIAEFALVSRAVSKYRLGVSTLGLVPNSTPIHSPIPEMESSRCVTC